MLQKPGIYNCNKINFEELNEIKCRKKIRKELKKIITKEKILKI